MTSDYRLDDEAYHAYSPIFLSTTSILSYGLGFAAVTSVVVHAFLNHRIEIWAGLKETFTRGGKLQKEDIHTEVRTNLLT